MRSIRAKTMNMYAFPQKLDTEEIRRRLVNFDTIEVDNQCITFIPEQWQRRLGKEEACMEISRKGALTRADIAKLASEARREDNACILRVFYASMMWGFGRTGYGHSGCEK